MAVFGPPGLSDFQNAFEINPITLVGGLAANIQGGKLPILALTEPGIYSGGLLGTSGAPNDLDDYFAHWLPLPSTTLIDNQIGKYPFANQQVAANAIIFEPLHVSMLMICHLGENAPLGLRFSIMSNLQAQIYSHILAGGLFNVATPSYVYQNCVLLRVEDIGPAVSAELPLAQVQWRWDFEQPLVTLTQATFALSVLMRKLDSGTQLNGQPQTSGTANTQGNPTSGVTQPTIPTTQSQPSSFPQTSWSSSGGTGSPVATPGNVIIENIDIQ